MQYANELQATIDDMVQKGRGVQPILKNATQVVECR